MSKPKYQIGDRVKVKNTLRTGTVRSIFDADIWNLWGVEGGGHEYSIAFDDEAIPVNIVERVLEYIEEPKTPGCTCGLNKITSGGRHSEWCQLSGHEVDLSSKKVNVDIEK